MCLHWGRLISSGAGYLHGAGVTGAGVSTLGQTRLQESRHVYTGAGPSLVCYTFFTRSSAFGESLKLHLPDK